VAAYAPRRGGAAEKRLSSIFAASHATHKKNPTPPPSHLLPHPHPIPAAADLSSPMAAVNARDPTVKGGRWDPEFVWNTDWERAVRGGMRRWNG